MGWMIKPMKFSLLLASVLLAASNLSAASFYSLSSTGVAGRAHVVVPGILNYSARVEYVNVTGDAASSAVVPYTLGDYVTATANQDSVSNIVTVSSVTGFASNDVVVAQVGTTATTAYRFVLLATNSTSFKVTGTFGFTVTSATRFRKATALGSVPVGNTNAVWTGNVINGQRGLPLLIDATGTTSPNLNLISGSYEP